MISEPLEPGRLPRAEKSRVFRDARRSLPTRGRRSSRDEFGVQGRLFFETTYAENAKANDTTLIVDKFHHGFMRGFPLETDGIGGKDFEEIRFYVKPDFYFIGRESSPVFRLAVR